MGKIKQKRKFASEPHLSAKYRSAKKRARKDVAHRMIMIYLERKTRSDVYGNVRKIINDSIDVSPSIT